MPKALRRGEAGTRCRRRYSGDRYHSGGFLLRAMPPSWHPVPACTPPQCCRRAVLLCRNENWNRTRNFVAAGTVVTPAAFYLGLCRLRGIQSPPASATASCRRNRSPLRQRRIESDADLVAATATVGGPFFTAAARTLHRFPSLDLKSRIDARRRA